MKFLLFLVLILVFSGQESNAQLGGWFRWSNTQYEPTAEEYSDVVKKINSGLIESGIWYQFSSGERYQVMHPQEWRNLLLESYKSVDNTTTFNNLPERIKNSEEVIWGDDLKETRNYYWSKNGTIEYVPNYSGKRLKFLVWNGFVTLKKKCGNPQGNYFQITQQATPPSQKQREEVVEHNWRTYVAPIKSVPKNPSSPPPPPPPPPVINPEYSGFYKWQRRNGWWAYSLASGVVITGVGFVAHDNQHQWYLWFPKGSPHGTMSNGRGDVTTNNTGTGTQDGGRGD